MGHFHRHDPRSFVFRLSLVRSLLFDRLGLFRFLRHRSKFSRRSLFAFSIGHILIIFNYYYFYPEEWSSILGKCIILQSRCFVLRNFFEKFFFQIPSTVDRLSRSLKATQRVESATRQQSNGLGFTLIARKRTFAHRLVDEIPVGGAFRNKVPTVIRFQLMRSLSDKERASQTVRAGVRTFFRKPPPLCRQNRPGDDEIIDRWSPVLQLINLKPLRTSHYSSAQPHRRDTGHRSFGPSHS